MGDRAVRAVLGAGDAVFCGVFVRGCAQQLRLELSLLHRRPAQRLLRRQGVFGARNQVKKYKTKFFCFKSVLAPYKSENFEKCN